MDVPEIIINFLINIIPIISVIYIIAGIRFAKYRVGGKFDYFSLFMFFAALYSIGYFLELVILDVNSVFIIRNIEYLGVCFIPATAILFVSQLAKNVKVTKLLTVSLFLVSSVFWVLFITNPLHSLFYKEISYQIGKYGGYMLTEKGLVFYVLLLYFLIMIVYSVVILLKAWLTAKKTYKRKSFRFLFYSFQISWLTLAVISLGWDDYVDPTPLTIMIICGLFVVNEYNNGAFELQIRRWECVFKDVGESAFLIDGDGEIICENSLAASLLREAGNEVEATIISLISDCEHSKTVFFTCGNLIRWFDVRKSGFDLRKNLMMILFVDITGEIKSSLVAESFFNAVEDFIFIGTQDGEILFVNAEVKKRLGYSEKEIAGMRLMDFRASEDRPDIEKKLMQLNSLDEMNCDYPLLTKSGESIPVETRVWKGDWNGKPVIYCMSRDITEREMANERLRASEEQFRRLISQMQQGLAVHEIICDNDGNPINYRFISANESFERVTGLKVSEIIGKTVLDILPDTEKSWIEKYGRVAITGKPIQLEDYSAALNRYFSVSAYSPRENQFAVIVSDITDKKKKEAEIEYLSYHDQLTGLNNRRYYEILINKLDDKQYYPLTLIMADVNGLKLTNDAFGHQAGDLLLRTFANLLKRECRSDDIISRIGGDEFIILLPRTDAENAAKIIGRINNAIAEEKVDNVILSVSIGYAVKLDSKTNIDEIFKQAEDDMYRHKLSESTSMRSKTISLIMNSLYEKNHREMLHSQRVGQICEAIAAEMGFDKASVDQMKIAGLMHDIGKIGISDSILNNPGRLNGDEWNEIHRHSEIGYRILSSVNEFSKIAEYVLQHHERWDGKGYPKKISGDKIYLEARIISVADSFDAMTTDRTYRSALSEQEAVSELLRQSGKQYDPEIVRVFIDKVLKS